MTTPKPLAEELKRIAEKISEQIEYMLTPVARLGWDKKRARELSQAKIESAIQEAQQLIVKRCAEIAGGFSGRIAVVPEDIERAILRALEGEKEK